MELNHFRVAIDVLNSRRSIEYSWALKFIVSGLLLISPISQSFGVALQWNTFAGSAEHDFIEDTATDAAGTVYTLYRRVNDIRLVKTNNVGIHQGDTVIFTADAAGTGGRITLDAAGNVYVAGMSRGPWGAPVNSHSGEGANDVYVAKLSNTGQIIWNTFVGDDFSDDQARGIAVDSEGNVIITGYSFRSWGTPLINHTNGPFGTLPGNRDAFIAKFDDSGNLTWNTFLGSPQDDSGDAVTVDSSDNIYAGGQSVGNWGGPVVAHTGGIGNNDVFAVKLNSAGTVQWNTFAGGSIRDEETRGIDVDSSGNVYVAGGGSGAWGTPVNPASGSYEGWVGSFSNSGALQWHSFLGGAGPDFSFDVVSNDAGAIYVAGRAAGIWGNPIASPASGGGQEAYVARLTGSDALSGVPGTLEWNISMGSPSYEEAFSVNLDGNGDVTLGISGRTDWGSPVVPYIAQSDVGIAKICVSCIQVTATVDAGGTLPFSYVAAASGETTSLLVLPKSGYITDSVVGGTCAPGSFNSSTYTTGVVTAPCTLSFTHTNYVVSAFVENNGSAMPASVTTSSGNTVNFTVTPDSGYFVTGTQVYGNCPAGSWAGNIYTTGITTAPCTAVFEPQLITYTATATSDANGSFVFIDSGEDALIVGNGGSPQMASRNVIPGGMATFSIQANEGFETDSVVGGTCPAGSFGGDTDLDGSIKQYTTGAIFDNCSLSFTHTALPTFTVTASTDSNGSISNPVTEVFQGGQVQVTILSDEGFKVDENNVFGTCPLGSFDKELSGGMEGPAETTYTTGEIDGDCTVIFNHLAIPSFTVMALVDDFGSLDSNSATVFEGDQARFELSSDEGYHIDQKQGGISGDCPIGGFERGLSLQGVQTNTMVYFTDNISADCTVSFMHTLNQYEVELILESDNVTVTPSIEYQEVNHGESLSFTIVADNGFAPSIGGSCGGTLVGDTYTTLPVTDYCTVSVDAVSAAYLISTQIDASRGSIFPEFFNIGSGETVGFEITPAEGFEVSNVSGCGGTWVGANPYTIAPATEDCTVEPTFGEIGANDAECSFFSIVAGTAVVTICL